MNSDNTTTDQSLLLLKYWINGTIKNNVTVRIKKKTQDANYLGVKSGL